MASLRVRDEFLPVGLARNLELEALDLAQDAVVDVGHAAPGHLVTVEGAVDKPGVYSFQPGARLSTAVAMASGPKRTAKVSQVAVFRESPQGVMVAKFDYAQVSRGAMLDPVLEPGDRVVMGTDGLSVFWEDLLKALPVFGVFAVAGRGNN